MLKGLRTAIKYFTIGVIAGLIFAPRKGSETFRVLVSRGKEYAQDSLGIGERARRENEE